MYQNGLGVPQDYQKAMSFYQVAARTGFCPALVRIGALYYKGRGVPKDYKKAMHYYQQAGGTDLSLLDNSPH